MATAQTALIAHRSHGGSLRTFRPARSVHNFGIPPGHLEAHKLVWLSGTQAVRYARWADYHGRIEPNAPTRVDTMDLRMLTGQQQLPQVLSALKQRFPKAELVGFDKARMQATWPQAQ